MNCLMCERKKKSMCFIEELIGVSVFSCMHIREKRRRRSLKGFNYPLKKVPHIVTLTSV